MTFDLHATPQEIMRAVEALQDFGRAGGIGERTLFGLALVLEECASNIVNHALQRDERRTFRVRFKLTDDRLEIELRDGGPMFDPTLAPAREPSADDDDHAPGGWGIQIVRRYTDEVRYVRENEENVLLLIKRLNPPAG
jgi:serine/threonine-protein kinase RsbW